MPGLDIFCQVRNQSAERPVCACIVISCGIGCPECGGILLFYLGLHSEFTPGIRNGKCKPHGFDLKIRRCQNNDLPGFSLRCHPLTVLLCKAVFLEQFCCLVCIIFPPADTEDIRDLLICGRKIFHAFRLKKFYHLFCCVLIEGFVSVLKGIRFQPFRHWFLIYICECCCGRHSQRGKFQFSAEGRHAHLLDIHTQCQRPAHIPVAVIFVGAVERNTALAGVIRDCIRKFLGPAFCIGIFLFQDIPALRGNILQNVNLIVHGCHDTFLFTPEIFEQYILWFRLAVNDAYV